MTKQDGKLSTKAAIQKVLASGRKPMTVAQIAEAALPLTALAGKTPRQTDGTREGWAPRRGQLRGY